MHPVLILGCGAIAGGYDAARPGGSWPLTHAGAFSRHHAFEILACVDPDEGRREAFRVRWNIAEDAASLSDLACGNGRFDVISICSPTDMHSAHVEAALALGPRLIFCEKPVAPTACETERLVGLCAAAGTKLAVNHTRRWAPDVVRLGVELRAGAWGAVRSVSGHYTKGVVHNGSHMVDLLHMLLGPVELIATGTPVFDFWDDDPTVPVLLRTEDGVPVQLATGHAGDFALFELTLVTERAAITMLDGGRRWAIRHVGDSSTFAGYRELGPGEVREGQYDRAMLAAVANIADAIDEGAPLASDGTNALAAQRLCETIRSAALADHPPSSDYERIY